MTKISEEAIKKIQANRQRVREALTVGVRAYASHNPDKLVAVKAGDLDTLLDWLNEFCDREQHSGLITK